MPSILNPYLTFNGNAGEAMKFYHSVLGGELNIQTFKDAKMAHAPEEEDRIIHATLKSDSISIMASDSMLERPAKFGDNVHMSITGEDGERLTQVFNGLSKGGTVDMPLAKQFWGDTYGQFTDKYGIHWMINITSPKGTT